VAVFGEEGEDAAAAFEAAVVEVSEAAEEAAIAVDAAGVIAAGVAVEDEEEAEVDTTTVIATAIMVATEDINQEAMAVVTEQIRVVAITKAEEVTAQEVEAATSSRVAAGEATSRAAGAATEQTRAAPHAEDTELATRSQVNTGLLRQGVINSRLQVIHMGPLVVQTANTERNPLQAASMGLSKQHHQRALGEATHTANSMALGQLTGHNQPVQQLHTTQRNRHLLWPLGNSNSMVRIEVFHLNRI